MKRVYCNTKIFRRSICACSVNTDSTNRHIQNLHTSSNSNNTTSHSRIRPSDPSCSHKLSHWSRCFNFGLFRIVLSFSVYVNRFWTNANRTTPSDAPNAIQNLMNKIKASKTKQAQYKVDSSSKRTLIFSQSHSNSCNQSIIVYLSKNKFIHSVRKMIYNLIFVLKKCKNYDYKNSRQKSCLLLQLRLQNHCSFFMRF